MSFETQIPEHIKAMEKQRSNAEYRLREFIHDCNCDYCERTGFADEDSEIEAECLQEEINEIDRTIERLKRHAALHHLDWATGRPLRPHPAVAAA